MTTDVSSPLQPFRHSSVNGFIHVQLFSIIYSTHTVYICIYICLGTLVLPCWHTGPTLPVSSHCPQLETPRCRNIILPGKACESSSTSPKTPYPSRLIIYKRWSPNNLSVPLTLISRNDLDLLPPSSGSIWGCMSPRCTYAVQGSGPRMQ